MNIRTSLTDFITWLKRNQWDLVFVIGAVAFVSGFTGVYQLMGSTGKDPILWDLFYFTIRLFLFNYDLQGEGIPYAPAPPLLQVARILAPLTVSFVAGKAFMLAVEYEYGVWRVRNWKKHVVVCGIGKRGEYVATELRKAGRQVVVIEKNADVEALTELKRIGVRVVIGSGTNRLHQSQACIRDADLVLALTSSEETNLEVAEEAANRVSTQPMEIIIHASRQFAGVFEHHPLFNKIKHGTHVRFYDHYASGARMLLKKFAIELTTELTQTPRPPRILVVGDGELISELLGVAMMQCQYAFAGLPKLVVATPDLGLLGEQFPISHPQLEQVACVNFVSLSLPELGRLEPRTLIGGEVFDLVFVACREDLKTLSLARHFTQQRRGDKAEKIVACLKPSTDVMRSIADKNWLPEVEIRNLVELGYKADVLLYGELDREARVLHEDYVKSQIAAGFTEATNPSLAAWENLPRSLRQANRAQADHIPVKQRALAISQSEQMVEALAEAEHRRWMAEKIVAGWRYSEQRDNARKLHPSLKPYSQLSEPEKQKDRDAVLAVLKKM